MENFYASVVGLSASEISSAAPQLGAATLDRVVAELCEIQRRTGIDRTLAIGELVLSEFFAGEPASWQDRRRNKNNSIRRLAERPDCPLGKSALNEAVGIFVAVATMPRVRTSGHITSSHIAATLVLPPAARVQVLEDAAQMGWSVREVKERVVQLRGNIAARCGRPNPSVQAHQASQLRGSVRGLAKAVTRVTQSSQASSSLRETVTEVAQELSNLRQLLENWVNLDTSPRLGNVIGIADSIRT